MRMTHLAVRGRRRAAMTTLIAGGLAGICALTVDTTGLTSTRGAQAAPAISPGAASASGAVGISPGSAIMATRATGRNLGADLDAVVATGATWLRIDVNWCWVEQARGDRADERHWSEVDEVVDAARARGLNILGIVRGTAAYATTANGPCEHGPENTAERREFAGFAQAAAARYRDRIGAWEVWNEPNLATFWNNTPNATTYAELVKESGPAIRAGNPDATVVAGGTGGAGSHPDDQDSVRWYEELYRTPGVRDSFDAAAVHPYVNIAGGAAQIPSGELSAARRIRTLIDDVDPGTPLWATEVGLPTAGTPGADGDNHAVSEAAQAAGLQEITRVWHSIEPAGPLFYYGLVDNPADPTREGYFGYVTADGRRKPAFTTLQQLAAPQQAPGQPTSTAASSSPAAPSATPPPAPSSSAPPTPVSPTRVQRHHRTRPTATTRP